MSMTWEKATNWIADLRNKCSKRAKEYEKQGALIPMDAMYPYIQALDVALSALRPVSQEKVEKVWTGCEKCREQTNWQSWIEKGFVYCPKCGTPLTSWAWKKQVERLEALNDGKDRGEKDAT